MQLEALESFVYKLYKINLTKLMHLSHKRQEEALDLGETAEYHQRIEEDDRYCQISAEIDRIREKGDLKAKLRLFNLMSGGPEQLSDIHLEALRQCGAGSKREVFATAKRTLKSRDKERTDGSDRDFLKSCGIYGETSWIK